ncbi:MAG: hypothetical protein KA715_13340 [Xanthomonadaceae bacterium]|nr:hypothetical protein [Xanthomonadaceae bacterium]
MQNSILTVGSMAFDSVQTPAGKAEQVLGGSVNYFSVAASFFSPVQIVAVVGEDFPDSHLKWLETRKINTKGVQKAPGKTFHWVGSYDQNLNEAKTLSTFLNVFEHFNPTLTDEQKKASYLFLGNIDPVLQTRVLEQNTSHKLVAMDSMNFWITGKPTELKQTLKQIDVLSINEGEAYLLSGQKNIVRAAQTIRDMGPSVLIIKRGEFGAALFTDTGTFLAPAYPTATVVDPTGAGDSFAGAFFGYIASHGFDRTTAKSHPEKWDHELRNAVLHGCVMASFTVEDFSLHRLMRLEKAEFDLRFKTMTQMIKV